MSTLSDHEFTSLCEPISAHEPCGPSLEYDHEFAVLLARLTPRTDAQYGDFVGTPEAPNWPDIERDCRRLLLRSRDINLLVWLCRARTRLGQAQGLASALGALRQVLHTWPEAVHPQIVLDGHAEPAVRGNALAALVDPEGLLADVCDIVVSNNAATRLTVRDVERAFSIPPPADAMSPHAVTLQLAALRAQAAPAVTGLAEAAEHIAAIAVWSEQHLGDDAPSLLGLSRILQLFAVPSEPAGRHANGNVDGQGALVPTQTGAADTGTQSLGRTPDVPTTRNDILAIIRQARAWYEEHEPSSPVPVLLKQAERLVGKRFAEVAHCIPPDLLEKWAAEDLGEALP